MGGAVAVERVPELVPREVPARADAKPAQPAPAADPREPDRHDATGVGCPTRHGRMAARMSQFWDRTGGPWARGALIGKVGSAFSSTASRRGGQETTPMPIYTMLFHHGGMVPVGLPCAAAGPARPEEVAGGRGERRSSGNERALARFQGRHLADIAARLTG